MNKLLELLLLLAPREFRRCWSRELLDAYRQERREATRDRRLAYALECSASVLSCSTLIVVAWWRRSTERRPALRPDKDGITRMEALLLDLRTSLRNLRRRPSYAVLALLTLTVGIAANTLVFSLVNGVLLEPLPFEGGDRLVTLVYPASTEADISRPDGEDLRERTRTMEQVALFMPFWALDLAGSGEPTRLAGTIVEPQYFELLGSTPLLGRLLVAADDQLGAQKVVVLSERLWRERFAADTSILGRSLQLSDESYTVVGVAPRSADVFELGSDVWVAPLPTVPWVNESRGTNNFEVLARLAPGVSLQSAGLEMRAIFEELEAAYPATNRNKTVVPVPVREFLTDNLRATLWLLFGAVGLVLLIVCANLAILVLLRSTARARELATRQALGGSSRALMRLLCVETGVLGILGGVAGTVLAFVALPFVVARVPVSLPRADLVAIDPTVLVVTLGAAFLVTLAAGLLPALLAVRSTPASRLAGRQGVAAAGVTRRAFQGGLVAAEVALAFLLLVGSILLLRSLEQLRSVDLGFDPEGVLVANLVLPESRYGELEQQDLAFGQIVEALEALPSVSSSAFVIGAPLANFGDIGSSVVLGDRPLPEPGERTGARIRPTLGDLTSTLGLRILQGRDFESRQRGGALEAIVNRSFAERHWPEGDAVGKTLSLISGSGEPEWRQIVGVVEDVRSTALSSGDALAIYMPYAQRNQNWQRFGTVLLRTELDPETLTGALQEAIWSMDPNLPVEGALPLSWAVERSTARERFISWTTSAFTVFALWIAIQGIYGVVAFTVRRRRNEIGLRLALGAERLTVLRSTMLRSLKPVAVGLGVGVLGALALSRLMTSVLFGVDPLSPTTYVVATIALVAAALGASALPAHRASRIDPATTLRDE